MPKSVLRFTATIKIRGINPYISVSAMRARCIKPNWRKPMPVLLRVNDKPEKPWRINMMPAGDGSFYLYLHGNVRKASGTQVGDRASVEISFDARYRNGPMHPMPSLFKQALSKMPAAAKNWQALSPSRKKEVLRYFAQLKSSEAQARNLERALHVLSGKQGRFMGRLWSQGK